MHSLVCATQDLFGESENPDEGQEPLRFVQFEAPLFKPPVKSARSHAQWDGQFFEIQTQLIGELPDQMGIEAGLDCGDRSYRFQSGDSIKGG